MRFRFVKKILRIIALILPCFAFSLFFSSNSFAVSSVGPFSSQTTVCHNTNSSYLKCSDFSFVSLSLVYSGSNPNSSPYPGLTIYKNNGSSILDNFRYLTSNFSSFSLVLPLSGVSVLSVKPQLFDVTATFYTSDPFGSSPSGSLSITSNGTYDVSSYAEAVVDVPPVPGDYHDDLVNVRNAILICGAILLVIYFFYAIYKMILGGSR